MEKAFKHPLARKAKTVRMRRSEGAEESVLLIVTTMELTESAHGFSRKNYDRLHQAAAAYLADAGHLAGYAIVNRPKEWDR